MSPDAAGTRIFEFGIFRLDPAERLLLRDGQPVALTPKAFDLLVYLVERDGHLVEKQTLLSALWPDAVVEETNLASNVSALRRILDDADGNGSVIQTVPTRGYRFAAKVTRAVVREPVPASPAVDVQPMVVDDSAPSALAPPGRDAAPAGRRALSASVWVVAGMVAAGLWVKSHDRAPARGVQPNVRSLLDVKPAEELHGGGDSDFQPPGGSFTAFAWTPDGRALVFAGRTRDGQRLYLRTLDRDEAHPIAGTDGAQGPVISTDGRWVAFWADRAIKKVPLAGGPVEVLAPRALPPFGMTWSPDGSLLFADEESPIRRLGPAGDVSDLTRLGDSDRSHRLPSVLPGGQVVLYTVRRRTITWRDEEIVAEVRATGARKILLRDAVDARYVASGHLLFLRRGTLFAVGFDPERLEVRGTPLALLDGVSQALAASDGLDLTGAGQVAVSSTGMLAWVPGAPATLPTGKLVAVDRRGRETSLEAPLRTYSPMLRVSPDGRRIALTIYGLEECAIWIFDADRGTLTKLTPEGEAFWPTWSPDGRRVAFDWLVAGKWTLASQLTDASASPNVVVPGSCCGPTSHTDSGHHTPSSWSRDGRLLATIRGEKDIWIVNVAEATARPLLDSKFREQWPEFSPDGGWLAYADDSSGHLEVYVRPYPGPGPRMQVSTEGGWCPAWNPGGHELFFLGHGRMMVVNVEEGSPSGLHLGRPRPLFDVGDVTMGCYPTRCYDVMPDGQRFIGLRQAPVRVPSATHIRLVQNWVQELSAKVPSGLTR